MSAQRAEATSWHNRAANGDSAALYRIACAHYERSQRGDEPAIIALARAVEYARLAAINGGRQESVALMYLLEQHSHEMRDMGLNDLADLTQGQAFALAEHMANQGDQEVADMLVAGAGEVEPGVLLAAKELMGVVH